MASYIIRVVKGGEFLFRTEADSDKIRALRTYKTLKANLPASHEVAVYRREDSHENITKDFIAIVRGGS